MRTNSWVRVMAIAGAWAQSRAPQDYRNMVMSAWSGILARHVTGNHQQVSPFAV